jgi:hypothetical protein
MRASRYGRAGAVFDSANLVIFWYYWFCSGAPDRIGTGTRHKKRTTNLRRTGTSRSQYWVHALIVGLALTGEIHLFSVELFHQHTEVGSLCRFARGGGPHLHSGQDIVPLCPLCQMARGSSVRPVTQTLFQQPHLETSYRLVSRDGKYSYRFTTTLPARSPPNA